MASYVLVYSNKENPSLREQISHLRK